MNKVRRPERGPVKFRDEKTVSGIGGRAVKLVNHLALSDPRRAHFRAELSSDSKLPRFASLLTRNEIGAAIRSRGPTYWSRRAARERKLRPRNAMERRATSVNCDSLQLMPHSRASAMIILLNCWRSGSEQDCFCFRDLSVRKKRAVSSEKLYYISGKFINVIDD